MHLLEHQCPYSGYRRHSNFCRHSTVHPHCWASVEMDKWPPVKKTYNSVETLYFDGLLKEAVSYRGLKSEKGLTFYYVHILQECILKKAFVVGKQVHAHLIKTGCSIRILLWNTILAMYGKCGSVSDARHVFDIVPERDPFTWSTMIEIYCKVGHSKEAIALFQQAQEDCTELIKSTYIFVLCAIARITAFVLGKLLHACIIKGGKDTDIFIGSAVIDMYSKCGYVGGAFDVFNRIVTKDVVLWNTMITGFGQYGFAMQALALFGQMQSQGMQPNTVTLLSLLNACVNLAALNRGKIIHSFILTTGSESDLLVGSTLIHLYAKCGKIEYARMVFDSMPIRNVVTWSALLSGYGQQGQGKDALKLFVQMQNEGVQPDNITFINSLNACSSMAAFTYGKWVHANLVERGYNSDIILMNALIDMYVKCGGLEDACDILDRTYHQDFISRTAIIAGYVQYGKFNAALKVFDTMREEKMKLDKVTFGGLLCACASATALEQGKWVHSCIIKAGFASDNFVGSSLLDMYIECGTIENAHHVFDSMPRRDIILWDALVVGYAQHGDGVKAIQLVAEMEQEGVHPDKITFVSLLSACNHAGLMEEAYHYFTLMMQVYYVIPIEQHYACVIDLLGRAGHLDEVNDFTAAMPLEHCPIIWTALLGAYTISGNTELINIYEG